MTEYIIMTPENTKKLYNILAGHNPVTLTTDGRFVYPLALTIDPDFPYKDILQDPANTIETISDANIRNDI